MFDVHALFLSNTFLCPIAITLRVQRNRCQVGFRNEILRSLGKIQIYFYSLIYV